MQFVEDKENMSLSMNNVNKIVTNNNNNIKSKQNVNGIRINSKVIFNFGGQNKVALRNQKDSDDEYSIGTLTPFTPMTGNKKTPLKDNLFSPYADFFNKSSSLGTKIKFLSSPDSDDELSTHPTPMKSPLNMKSPMKTIVENEINNNLDDIVEETTTTTTTAMISNVTTETNDINIIADNLNKDLSKLVDNGILVHKICNNDIKNQHKRILYLDSSHTYFYWTDKKLLNMNNDKKEKFTNKLKKTKSWLIRNEESDITTKTEHIILISDIESVTVGSGKFNTYIKIYTKKGRGNKINMFNIIDDNNRQCLLNSLSKVI